MHVKYIWFKVPVRGKQRIKSDIIPFISTLYLHNGMDTFFEHPIGWKTEDTYTHNKISNSTILKQTYIKKNTLGLFNTELQLNLWLNAQCLKKILIQIYHSQSYNFSHHINYSFQFLVNRKGIKNCNKNKRFLINF